MKHWLTAATLAGTLAALCALPVQAKKAPVDPGVQLCEIDWTGSFGKLDVKQTYSGAGELVRNEVTIVRHVPSDDFVGSTLRFSHSRYWSGGYEGSSRSIALGLGAPYSRDKDQRLIVAMPGAEPLIINAEHGGLMIPLSDAQLTRLLDARQRLDYRLVKVDRNGAEKEVLRQGWFDLSGYADQPLADLPQQAERARAIMTEARKGPKPPCVMAQAAEMNAMDSGEATRRWLSFDCREHWDSPAGAFELREASFAWRPRPRDSVTVAVTAGFRGGPPAIGTTLLTKPVDPQTFGQILISFGKQNWGANYRSTDPAQRERQSAELRRGKYAARHWLARNGGTGFSWYEYGQILAGEGDLEISAYDKVSEAVVRSTLPWADVLAAEAELQAGRRRMDERERDPMTRCKAVVDEELGMEQIIVT